MLDLKAKLASAGLITDEDIERVEKAKRGKAKRKGRDRSGARSGGGKSSHALDVAGLKRASRGDAYTQIRRWVERVRLDPPSKIPSDDAKAFHFATAKGPLGRLVVEPDVHGWLSGGGAGVIAFMSNHGLAHAVVPAEAARAVAEVYPLWLRVLVGDARAGQRETVPEPAASQSAPSPDSQSASPSNPQPTPPPDASGDP